MKVLVTGGYGFIGSHVAERFNKEGYEVFIIDNLVSGNIHNVNFKHKGYRLSVEERKCEEIFRSNRFDVVVHLAAQVDVMASIENPRQDTKSNVLGLVNMLTLAKKYDVKKFIFASSAAVYGMNDQLPLNEEAPCNPISPYGISKWVGESYCLKWEQMYQLDTLCFRFSNVYGPRQGSVGEGGVVSIFMERALKNQDLLVYGNGEQTRDFIYVEDVADAIYRSSYSQLSGVYNLSTNIENSVNTFIDILTELHDVKEIVYKAQRKGDIERSTLDNTRIKRDLDWSPIYTFTEGLKRTYTWFKQNDSVSETELMKETKPSEMKLLGKRIKPFVENLVVFFLIAWVALSQMDIFLGFIDIKMFYIMIIGIIYGKRQSITASALSIGLLIYQKLLDGRELISLLYDTEFFFQVAVYLFIGLVVGYAIDRKNRLIESQLAQVEDIEEKYEFLNSVYSEVREVKEELQQRIQNSEDSFGKIYSITKELESLVPEEIVTSTISVVESIMRTNDVSIYTVNSNGSYLRLVAHSIGREAEKNKSIKVENFSYINQMFLDRKIYVNKNLTEGIPLMSAPIQNNGETVAIIAIDGIEFEKFSLYHQNLFKITVDLVSSALSRAFSYIEATEGQRYVEGTSILNKEVFAVILQNKKLAKAKHDINYLLASYTLKSGSLSEISQKMTGLLRETDYIGMGANGDILILLSNSGLSEASLVVKRFADQEISLQLLEEEVVHG
ncbi:NAD-dependent epimerase/dehydratase family protein [Paenibacillus sp. FA6]|uniref:NAD-dependent epimerase/dehydratase family protein n=1 Tax=Paenibacillus sp. FA6 TaxID=3413029 RepID=UPI003F654F11